MGGRTCKPLRSSFRAALDAVVAKPNRIRATCIQFAAWISVLVSIPTAQCGPSIELTNENSLAAWHSAAGEQTWQVAGNVRLDDSRPKALIVQTGDGVITSLIGDCPDLISRQLFSDVHVHLEFMIPRGSNSGVKLMGLYEIQIKDSHGVSNPSADDCGGIYPRAEQRPNYRLIDAGTPPRVNAAKPAGEWQTLDIVFVAPRFDARDKKRSNAMFVKVVLNGRVIHENVELAYPTGKAWRLEREVSRGPLLLQGDHGPVAFRRVRVRPQDETQN